LSGAVGASWGTLLRLHDLFSSPGYQLYLRFLFATLSPEAAIHASKVLSLAMFFASAVLLYSIGRRWFGATVGQVAAVLFLFSESWRYYCNVMQYEVLAGFLMMLLLAMLTSREPARSTTVAAGYDIAIGSVLAFLCILQSRYAVLLALPLAHSWLVRDERMPRNLRRSAVILAVAFALLGAWVFIQSVNQGRMIPLQSGGSFRMRIGNNPNAMGYSFPLPAIVEPSGWRFVYSMPARWTWLVGQRALYLFGIKRDSWALPPVGFGSGPVGSYSMWNIIAATILAAGLALAIIRASRKELGPEFVTGIVLLAGITLPPLLLFGSERFIVPVIPVMALFQAYALVLCVEAFRARQWINLEARPAPTFALAASLCAALLGAIYVSYRSANIAVSNAPDIKSVIARISLQLEFAHRDN
jgi:hypothetical protein